LLHTRIVPHQHQRVRLVRCLAHDLDENLRMGLVEPRLIDDRRSLREGWRDEVPGLPCAARVRDDHKVGPQSVARKVAPEQGGGLAATLGQYAVDVALTANR